VRTVKPARLDPVGKLRLPRRATLLRTGLVAALLLTAAGVLYTGQGGPAPDGAPSPPATPGPLAGSAGAGPGAPGADSGPGATAGGTRLPIPDGLVGVPVSLGDPSSLAVLRPGDRIDLLAVPAAGGEPVGLATGALVLAVDRTAAALLLALTPEQGREVVSVPATTTSFVVVVHS
jgi:hypothetical protein